MKLLNLNGQTVKVDVRPSSFPIRQISRSKLQNEVGKFLQEKYASYVILEDFTIPDSRMSLDFFIPSKLLAFEIQGEQHYEHNSFFHGPKDQHNFAKQKIRDGQKAYFCELNNIKLVLIDSLKDLEQL